MIASSRLHKDRAQIEYVYDPTQPNRSSLHFEEGWGRLGGGLTVGGGGGISVSLYCFIEFCVHTVSPN
jgi:hypothetical protein